MTHFTDDKVYKERYMCTQVVPLIMNIQFTSAAIENKKTRLMEVDPLFSQFVELVIDVINDKKKRKLTLTTRDDFVNFLELTDCGLITRIFSFAL